MTHRALVLLCVLAFCVSVHAQSPRPGDSSKDDKDKDGSLLSTVGTLSAGHLHQAYLNIALLADARAEGVYDTPTATRLLGTVTGVMRSVDEQLDSVARLPLSDTDREALLKVRKQSAALKELATSLETFWKSGKKEDGAKYEKLRKKTWADLQELLGLKPAD